jgi:hypothetical protein
LGSLVDARVACLSCCSKRIALAVGRCGACRAVTGCGVFPANASGLPIFSGFAFRVATREFLQDRLKVVKVDMESAETTLSEFASKNAATGISEQVRVTVENAGKLQGELIAAESQLEEVRQIYADSSPQVRSLQARISELVNQQKKLLGTYSGKAFVDGEASSSFPTLRRFANIGRAL